MSMPLTSMDRIWYNSNLQKHGSNLSYSAQWYPNYPAHHPNNQFLNAPPTSIGGTTNGLLDSDPVASSFYNTTAHQHMLHPTTAECFPDNYSNSQYYTSGSFTPPTSIHMSPPIPSHHNTNSANRSADSLQNGLQNIPSPPVTVNSACSEMSSPGVASNGNTTIIASGDTSPNMNSNNSLSRPKSPYEWMKKPSYQSQPNTGTIEMNFSIIVFCCSCCQEVKIKQCNNRRGSEIQTITFNVDEAIQQHSMTSLSFCSLCLLRNEYTNWLTLHWTGQFNVMSNNVVGECSAVSLSIKFLRCSRF